MGSCYGATAVILNVKMSPPKGPSTPAQVSAALVPVQAEPPHFKRPGRAQGSGQWYLNATLIGGLSLINYQQIPLPSCYWAPVSPTLASDRTSWAKSRWGEGGRRGHWPLVSPTPSSHLPAFAPAICLLTPFQTPF